MITASMLYDLVQCPHRVTMDALGDPALRDKISPFVQLLWERGSAFEKQTIDGLEVEFVDLSACSGEEKRKRTEAAMQASAPLIYAGRIQSGDLLGDPDLLRREGAGYVAGDIKSGSGEETGGDDDDGKPKKHYAVQLGLYTDILEQLGVSAGRRAFVWDIHGREVSYDFMVPIGVRNPRTLWEDYQTALADARSIIARATRTLPAYSSGTCKNCVWYSACMATLRNADDLTLIPELGRSKRDVMIDRIASVSALAEVNPTAFVVGKKTAFQGIGPETLEKLAQRARLLSTKDAKPYLRQAITLPRTPKEIFFDIEVDPMRDICYLHGFVERINGDNDSERFVAFMADQVSAEAEEAAFREAWQYMAASQPASIFYYSKYERTIYRKLRAKFPHVCSEEELEELFKAPTTIDLYFDVVLKATEWPTNDYSIKTLAKYLGFNWRDTHPSGAASIEWFHRLTETGDREVRQRILDYNEDDCRATRVLLDGIRAMAEQ